MSIPVNRLKLLAFVFGAAAAGLTGAIYGTIATAALPGDYDVGLLITIYAIMILGGFGSIMGIVVGAIVVSSVPELLRSSANARPLFYGAILLAILVKIRPWRRLAAELAGLVAFGFAVHAIASAAYPRLVDGESIGSGTVRARPRPLDALPEAPGQDRGRRVHPAGRCDRDLPAVRPRLARGAACAGSYTSSCSSGRTCCSCKSAERRGSILLGAMLVALMNVRPQGLFGTATVEIV